MSKIFCALFIWILFLFPSAILAQPVGEVVEVSPPAQIVSQGTTRDITQGSPVQSGDVIQTSASGKVQIIFRDETKIVVGPNSSLKIDETLFRNNGAARKFAVSAVGGTFRFISGTSPKQVYKLATPVATMGIRGTAFDFTVTAGQSTDLLVFDGSVRFCNRGQRCASVDGGCQAVTAERNGTYTQPMTAEEKLALLVRRFPLIADQPSLQPPFRVGTNGCSTVKIIRLPRTRDERDSSLQGPDEGQDNPADGPPNESGGGGNPAE